MPDQDRKPSSFLSHDPGDGVRCPVCPGLIGVSFQADCVCCGRQVAASTQPDSKAKDLTESVKALSIKTEDVVPQVYLSSQYVTRSVAQESQPVEVVNPACPKISNRRQRRCNIPVLKSCSTLESPGSGTGDGVGSTHDLQLAGSSSRSAAIRIYQQSQYVMRTLPSRRIPTRGGSRGGVGRGTNAGAHHKFKGVRTREGVKGFLVEIRPPKWKKTIWLGTYSTSVEAAGAYDAGVFYTKKSYSKYNFLSSQGAFPPLPLHLQLDRADSMEEIKLFVQHQARAAARRMGTTATSSTTTEELTAVEICNSLAASNRLHEPSSSGSCIAGGSELIINSSSEQLVETESEFQIPMDLDYLGQCLHADIEVEEAEKDMFLDYTNYLSQQGAPDQQLLPEEDEEEEQLITTS